ncbi:tetanolysin-like [Macrosteles quadrilineatus]|uniref:tetanolysin-like n=1 Tax=Macrosteles quadrilineatus TaxID=74068 RepID=UPI0023E26D0B|nr:tetanolysin-like [Macrosteles quadrilineatus]
MGCLSLLLFELAAVCVFHTTTANNEIDSYIYGMNYSRDQVLAYKGESKTSVPVQTEGKMDANHNFIVITREKKTAQNGMSDIGVVTANEHRTYPGSLLLANQRLIDNSPDVLSLPRAPLTYTVNLPGLTTDGHFTIDPTFAQYQSTKENTLKTWFEKHPNDQSVVANFHSDYTFAYSQEYLRVKFGLEFKNTQVESSIDFSAMQKQEKLIMVHKFKQVFYTVSVEHSHKPSDLFAPSVTLDALKQKTDINNPPVIVDSVSYGRTIYVKLETSSTDREAKATLATKATNFDLKADAEAEIKSKLKNLNMQVFVIGGSSEHIQLINAKTFKEVNDVLVKYAKFSRDNLGYPISYSAQFIKDNSRAIVQMSTDYIETTSTIHSKGIIKIVHKGGFVMQWAVKWKEVSYDSNGAKVSKVVEWEKNWQDLTAPFEQDIELPGNAEDISVFAREATGVNWDWWRTIFDKKGIPLIDKRTFTAWGTTLHPESSVSPSV